MEINNIIIFGDIHGRPVWKDVVEKEYDADLFIFLGDYFTSRDGYDVQTQIDNWNEILDFKKQNPDKVILLRGNHCTEALKYPWAECYPKFYSDYFMIDENKQDYLDNTQWCYVIDNIVFSHAGISKTWFNNIQKEHPEIKCFNDINKLEPSELFAFTPEDRLDNYGDSKTQPLIWIRPEALINDSFENTIYIVGHTRTFNGNIMIKDGLWSQYILDNKVFTSEDSCIIQCDTLPSYYLTINLKTRTFDSWKV